ncbi:MAG TPA: hypothetical protein VJ577_20180 [Burkholderiaceae bacterium]|nr:hypothetical protein [Burkholderiaceae bacterium]
MNDKEFTNTTEAHSLFALGRIVVTRGALSLLGQHGVLPMQLVSRHVRGDWGYLNPEDVIANNEALAGNDRILSNYLIDGDDRVWVITEWGRSTTTLLLPSEY